ncbi:low affinity immunoglobulin epsilon Fc receptor-like [Pomacea canaliculata]|uniref:low affinity immunoglobulin epsilon Fc receptor-like n=1 Tax=Pomacea canaliculata TaxID=400727 RepID=UPI000D7265FD|nr:low affinity immunoglobulin epsilon Fc receptor-like [Pomacea canaliculata]
MITENSRTLWEEYYGLGSELSGGAGGRTAMEWVNMVRWWTLTLTSVVTVGASQWLQTSESCYYLHNVTQTFDNASATCRSLHSRLVTLETMSEYVTVTDFIATAPEVWVHLQRTYTTDPLNVWPDGTPVNSSMWVPGEPNNSGDCVRLVKNYLQATAYTRHLLADHPCTNLYLALCERPYVPAKTTSTRVVSPTLTDLCQLFQVPSASLLRCAQMCSEETTCNVYGYDKRAERCSLYKHSASCSQTVVMTTAVNYYNLWRYCY